MINCEVKSATTNTRHPGYLTVSDEGLTLSWETGTVTGEQASTPSKTIYLDAEAAEKIGLELIKWAVRSSGQ